MTDESERRRIELEDVPLQRPDYKDWPKGVRTTGTDELACLGIDKHGGFYWQENLDLHKADLEATVFDLT